MKLEVICMHDKRYRIPKEVSDAYRDYYKKQCSLNDHQIELKEKEELKQELMEAYANTSLLDRRSRNSLKKRIEDVKHVIENKQLEQEAIETQMKQVKVGTVDAIPDPKLKLKMLKELNRLLHDTVGDLLRLNPYAEILETAQAYDQQMESDIHVLQTKTEQNGYQELFQALYRMIETNLILYNQILKKKEAKEETIQGEKQDKHQADISALQELKEELLVKEGEPHYVTR